jgi:uncharacterized peroxidase-related enzyme
LIKQENAVSRTAIPARDDAPIESQATLNAIAKQLRFVPNLFRTASISPNALTGLINLRTAIFSALDTRTLARIALAVSQINECRYCLSLHTYLGMNYGGLSPAEIMLNRRGTSGNEKARTLVAFVQKVMRERGKVTDEDLQSMRESGYSDAQIIEVVTASVYYLFTNLINNVFDTDVDFPKIDVELVANAI